MDRPKEREDIRNLRTQLGFRLEVRDVADEDGAFFAFAKFGHDKGHAVMARERSRGKAQEVVATVFEGLDRFSQRR